MNNSKLPAYLFVAFAGMLLLLAVYKTFIAPKQDIEQMVTTPVVEEQRVPPTLSPEEREIISKIETLTVDITDTKITPVQILVKKNDQVAFYNKTADKTITIDGGDWGKVPLRPGENMTQSFKNVGIFKYQVTPMGLSGEVEVK